MMEKTLLLYQLLSCFLFAAGIFLIFARNHLIALFIGLELLLNASALSFATYTYAFSLPKEGYLFPIFIIVIAAAEAAVALAIAIRFYQNKESSHVADATVLQG